MGKINNAFLKVAGSLATAAAASEMNESQKVKLANENIDLTEEAAKIDSEHDAIVNSDDYKLLTMATQRGATEKDKVLAAQELKKYQDALDILELKRKANQIQRADWERRVKRIGGLK